MRAFGKTNVIGRKDMYPYYIIGDIDLYSIFIMLGIIAAVIVYRLCADRANINAKLYNFTLICALCSIVSGFVFSVLFQAIYNIKYRGAFIIDGETGATFAGGLTGGAATFLFVYFIFGKKYESKKYTRDVIDCAACAIPSAHAFGRIGCLMGGCCYGKPTDSPIGIYMVNLGYKVVPVQLFEAIFLFALATVLIILLFKGKKHIMELYMLSFGVFRFIIEFFRDDERGTLLTGVFSPSQIISICLVIGAGALYFVSKRHKEAKA